MNTRATWWLTALGVLFTALMLFPVYWMINVSLTQTSNMRKSPPNLIPVDGTLDGYSRRPRTSSCPTSAPACSSVSAPSSLTLVARRARPATRWPSCARSGGGALSLVLLIAQMIPAIVMAMGFYAIYIKPRHPQLGVGPHPRRLDHRGARSAC